MDTDGSQKQNKKIYDIHGTLDIHTCRDVSVAFSSMQLKKIDRVSPVSAGYVFSCM